MGARNAWLGCPDSVCDLRICSTYGHSNNYANFGVCGEEQFQIIGLGTQGSSIKSGQRIRLRYLAEHNSWLECSTSEDHCNKGTCSGTSVQASNFSRCWKEMFRIFARGRAKGQTIYNGDVVMLYQIVFGRYVSIQGEYESSDTSLNFCPGVTPPAYLSYGICSKNVFRIYRKP